MNTNLTLEEKIDITFKRTERIYLYLFGKSADETPKQRVSKYADKLKKSSLKKQLNQS